MAKKTAAKGAKAETAKGAGPQPKTTKSLPQAASPAEAKLTSKQEKPTAKAQPVAVPAKRAAKSQPLATPAKAATKAQPVDAPAKRVSKARAEKAKPVVKATAPAPAAQVGTPKAVVKTVAAAAEATKQINERTTQMQNETSKLINDRTQALFGDVNERARETVERSSRIVEEMTDLTRGNVEAIVASSKVAARGIETLGQEVAEFSRRSFEEASAAVRNIAEVRSPTDFFRLQSDFARSAFDNVIAESSKMSEAMMKLVGEVAEPITSRYSVAAERVKNLSA
jgi:phasin family protein